jgi:hypothetical protein
MTLASRLTALILPSFVILASPARAADVQVATSIVCDTQQQAERFVALYDGDPAAAVNSVNSEAHDDNACGMLQMAYLAGPVLETARSKDMTFQIMPITVVGLVTPDGIQSVAPASFFTLFPVDERAA